MKLSDKIPYRDLTFLIALVMMFFGINSFSTPIALIVCGLVLLLVALFYR